jgi:hypothetical protein
MRARVALLAYLAAIVLATAVHEIGLLALGLGVVLVLAGRQWLRILRRACIAILFFNLVVTLSYGVIAGLQGTFSLAFVVLVNLRVLLLTCLTFLFVSRVNPFEALAFSRSLTYLFTLAYSQSMAFKYRHSASMGVHFLDKSLHRATEITQVMRSRGFFDD